MRGTALGLLLLAAIVAGCSSGSADSAGCAKDSDCKGSRICVRGRCRTPGNHGGPPGRKQDPPPSAGVEEFVVTVPPNHRNGVVKVEPSFGAPQVEQLPAGTHVGVTERSADGVWMRVRWPYPDGSKTGWMHRDILTKPGAPGGGVDCRTVDASLPCALPDRRVGVCKNHRCQDICPSGMSFSATDTNCHRPCGLGCKRCGFENLCDDASATASARWD